MTVTKADLDGLGNRVHNVEIDMSGMKSKVERTEEDVQKIFRSLEKLPLWIIGAVLIPSLLIIYQIVTK